MTLSASRLALSLPAAELQHVGLPGAVFPARQLDALPVSTRLRQAVRLVEMHCEELICVARPEMHAHGAARAWLAHRLDDVHEHVGISDGSAVKLIPGLRNHVFFHALDLHAGFSALQRLLRRTPEACRSLDSQINSAFTTVRSDQGRMPVPQLLLPTTPRLGQQDMPALLPLYLDPSSIEASVHHLLRHPARLPPLDDFARIVYAPLSQTALCTPRGRRVIKHLIRNACLDSRKCLLLRLPRIDSRNDEDTSAALIWSLTTLHELNLPLPTRPLDNILLCGGDLPEALLHEHADKIELRIDTTFPFWQYSAALYRRLRHIHCHAVTPGQRWQPAALLRNVRVMQRGVHSSCPAVA